MQLKDIKRFEVKSKAMKFFVDLDDKSLDRIIKHEYPDYKIDEPIDEFMYKVAMLMHVVNRDCETDREAFITFASCLVTTYEIFYEEEDAVPSTLFELLEPLDINIKLG